MHAKRLGWLFLLTLPFSALLGVAQVVPQYRGKKENLPRVVAPQPIPFSHKLHSRLGLTCGGCHSGAIKGARAGFPAPAVCLTCHNTVRKNDPGIQALKALHRQRKEPEWVRVYQLPDFVFFSHASHVKAQLPCKSCHGPVERREVLAQEVSSNMEMCMNCHKASSVSTECHLCHELGE